MTAAARRCAAEWRKTKSASGSFSVRIWSLTSCSSGRRKSINSPAPSSRAATPPANASSARRRGKGDSFVNGNDRPAQGVRHENVGDVLRLPEEQNLPYLVEHNGWDENWSVAFEIRGKKVRLGIGGEILEPTGGIKYYGVRSVLSGLGSHPSTSSPSQFHEAL